jgi:hypothetical protein
MGHPYLVAAYCCVWVIQLGYLASMAFRWLGQRRRLR